MTDRNPPHCSRQTGSCQLRQANYVMPKLSSSGKPISLDPRPLLGTLGSGAGKGGSGDGGGRDREESEENLAKAGGGAGLAAGPAPAKLPAPEAGPAPKKLPAPEAGPTPKKLPALEAAAAEPGGGVIGSGKSTPGEAAGGGGGGEASGRPMPALIKPGAAPAAAGIAAAGVAAAGVAAATGRRPTANLTAFFWPAVSTPKLRCRKSSLHLPPPALLRPREGIYISSAHAATKVPVLPSP